MTDWSGEEWVATYTITFLALLTGALQNRPVTKGKGGDIWGQKGRGWERNRGVTSAPSRVLTCHVHSFWFYFGTMDKARWHWSTKKTPKTTNPPKPENIQEVCPRGSLRGNWGAHRPQCMIRLEHNSWGDGCTHTWDFICRHATWTTNRWISRNNLMRATQKTKGPHHSPKNALIGRCSKFQGRDPKEREGMGLGAGLLEKGSCSCFHIHLLF